VNAMRARLASPLARPLAATLLLAAAYAGYQLWLAQVGAAVLPNAALAGGGRDLALAVTLAVDPEPFHMAKLQALGRVVEMRARTAFIADVAPGDARAFARNYWLERIEPWRRP